MQNKLHYAAHGHTAAEVIFERADAEKPFMGLNSFSEDMPEKKDIGIAKNYLSAEELKVLNNLVSGYFDIAEINAIEHKPMYMKDHITQLDAILVSGGRGLLKGAGTVSHAKALAKAEAEYQKFRQENLSSVEKAYLETLRQTQKSLKVRKNGWSFTSINFITCILRIKNDALDYSKAPLIFCVDFNFWHSKADVWRKGSC